MNDKKIDSIIVGNEVTDNEALEEWSSDIFDNIEIKDGYFEEQGDCYSIKLAIANRQLVYNKNS
ncbi:MAG TPA: hypothetical protein VKU94_06350 [Geobacterales bacterium]|nr:hypothetical protein [Geobacterales bacterium]